ncbi:MAG: 4-(cytidine 5'-diphospho)-2-C-methyl-D-erythritol kinase [Ilumatobacteraceae bacterium]
MTVTLTARAKLTLTLRIIGVRGDGYHLIDAEMVSLALADTLTIDPQRAGLTCDGPFAHGTPVDSSNLVARALKLAGRTAGVHIHKAVPHGGGLGGGSSDAAAVLRWAGYNDIAGAAAIGADVPFCLVGGRARVRGIGELIDPLPFEPMEITLVIPPLSINTPAAYRAWDELGGPHSQTNDLEAAAISVEPRLAEWRERIEKAAGERPTLAGSGATWFLRGHHKIADALPDALVVHTESVAAT